MWTRKELKEKAKGSFRANYWKSVLVALVVVTISVGFAPFSSAGTTTAGSFDASPSYAPDDVNIVTEDGQVFIDVDDGNGGKVHVHVDDETGEFDDIIHDISESGIDSQTSIVLGPGMMLIGFTVFLLVLVFIAVAMAVYVFVFSPLEVGASRFFVRNLNQRAEVKEVAYGYDNNYKEVVKTIFLRDLFIFLWSLLFIVPGIYKAYEYRMIPYLLAEDPAMTKDRAFSESKRMMDGQKWNAFVLDLSFLGWNILSLLTLGILGAFYVAPYQTQTNAALYEKLRYGLPAPAPAQPVPGQPMYGQPMSGQPMHGQPAPTQPMYGQPAPGQPMYGQPAATAPAAVVPVAASASAGSAPMEVAPVITGTAQPPVVPFAAVGAEPSGIGEDAAIDAAFEAPIPEASMPAAATPEAPMPAAATPEAPMPAADTPEAPATDVVASEAPAANAAMSDDAMFDGTTSAETDGFDAVDEPSGDADSKAADSLDA